MAFKASNTLWGEVLNTTNYLQNRSPTKVIPHRKTCIEVWIRKKPDLSHLKIFGSKAFALIQKDHRSKLDHHTIECTFLGYSDESKAYRLMRKYDKGLLISWDGIFKEIDNAHIEVDKKQAPISTNIEDFILNLSFLHQYTTMGNQSTMPTHIVVGQGYSNIQLEKLLRLTKKDGQI